MLYEMYSPVPGNTIMSFLIRNTTEVMVAFVEILFTLYQSLQGATCLIRFTLYSCPAKGQ